MPITKVLSVVALWLNCSVLLMAQSLTRDIIKYNFASSSFDTIAGVTYSESISAEKTNYHFGDMFPMEVPMEMPTENLTEGTNFTKPLVANDHYSMVNFPVSTTIKLFKILGDGELRDQCTGTMVGPKHMLTSAHCVLKPYTVEVVVDDLLAVAGYDVSMDSTDHIRTAVNSIYFMDDWNIGEGDDQAILELEEPIGFYTGWVSFGYNDDNEFFDNKNFHKFSYPTYRTPYNRFPFNGDTLYYSYGAIDYVADDFLGVVGHIYGAGGESGSSILYTNNDDTYTSYGVLTWVGYYNHSRFTAERFNAFKSIVGKTLLTDTKELIGDSQILLYPNPSRDNIFVELDTDLEVQLMTLHDVNGRFIKSYRGAGNSMKLDIGDLSEGLYHLRILTNQGLSAAKSFVKGK